MKQTVLKRIAVAAMSLVVGVVAVEAQNDIIVSQYIHNRFAVNPGFAGCRDGMSFYGGFRKQWTGIESTPGSLLLTAHTPMRSEKITGGLSVFGQHIHESTNAGLMMTVGYRTQLKKDTWLGLALQPGLSFRSTDWAKVRTMDEQDPVFVEKQTGVSPLLGFGAAIYTSKYFAGVSIQSLFVSDDFERRKAEFAPGDATYLLTGGYWFELSDKFALEPSVLVDYSKSRDVAADVTVSGIYDSRIWANLAYRTTKEMTIGVAYMPKVQMRIAYSYTISTGDLKSYDAGSHELSIQYDFVYHVKTVGHRFY
jgi:type IX secretion system PorP/SprF family membrane protein